MFFFCMGRFLSQADENGGKHREDIGLKKGYKQFQAVHENTQEHGDDYHRAVDCRSHSGRHKDDAGKNEYDGVTCHDIGKESDHQSKGLGEKADKLYKGHNGQGHL